MVAGSREWGRGDEARIDPASLIFLESGEDDQTSTTAGVPVDSMI